MSHFFRATTIAVLLLSSGAHAATYAPANSLNTKGVADSTINEPLPTYVAPAPSSGAGSDDGGGSDGCGPQCSGDSSTGMSDSDAGAGGMGGSEGSEGSGGGESGE